MGNTNSKKESSTKKVGHSAPAKHKKMRLERAYRCFSEVKDISDAGMDFRRSISGTVAESELVNFFECYEYASGIPGSDKIKKLHQYYDQFTTLLGNKKYSVKISYEHYYEDGGTSQTRCELSFVKIGFANVMGLLEVFSNAKSWSELHDDCVCKISYRGVSIYVDKFYADWKNFIREQLDIGFKVISLLGAAQKNTPYTSLWLTTEVKKVCFIPDVAEVIGSFLTPNFQLAFFAERTLKMRASLSNERKENEQPQEGEELQFS